MSQQQNQNISPFPIKRIAAIDLGTNSFHVVIVDIFSDHSFRRIDDLKEMVELAKGGLGKRLSKGAFKRGIEALKKIKVLCDSYKVDKILAYATSAIRESENGGDFIQKSIDDVGIKIHAIPGIMEAELIGYAVQHGIKLTEKPALIVDIGGGSVEFIVTTNNEFKYMTSRKIGVSRMTDIFKPNDPITDEDISKLTMFYEKEVQEVVQVSKSEEIDTIIGSSGTMQTIALMIAAQKGETADIMLNEYTFTPEDFRTFEQHFLTLDEQQRRKFAGMDERRVSFINTGVVLVGYLIRTLNIKQVKISTSALREGIIIRYVKNHLSNFSNTEEIQDPRRRSVLELARKCNWHKTHSIHVATMVLVLYEALKEEMNLSEVDKELLEYAALLHDIGYHISHSAHHKHAMYIIKHANLKGFTKDEIDIIAHVARYHRRSTPKKRHAEYWALNKQIRSRIKKLSAILRVADGLDRSHFQNVQKVMVDSSLDRIQINIETLDEPNLEIWGAMRKSFLLSELTGKSIQIIRTKDS